MIRPPFLVALTLKAALALAAISGPTLASAQAPVNGETIFRQRCQACHLAAAGDKVGIGPNLRGVVGRKAAETSFKYSPALQSSKVVWTKEALDRYLSGPARMIPGTRMVVSVSDPAQRAALLQYLSQTR